MLMEASRSLACRWAHSRSARRTRIQASLFANQTTYATVDGAISTDGQVVTLDINMPATGTVFGTVFGADGLTPAVNPFVSAVNIDSFGPEGNFNSQTTADVLGNYQ